VFKFFIKLFILILAVFLLVFYFLGRSEEKEISFGLIIQELSDLDNLEFQKVRLISADYIEEASKRGLEIILDVSSLNLDNLEKTVKKYQNYPTIKYWQVANEQQVHLIKAFDSKPVIITETSELSLWWGTSRKADVLGINIYKEPKNAFLRFFNINIPAWTYKLRVKIIRKPVIITELDPSMIDFAKEIGIIEQAYVKARTN